MWSDEIGIVIDLGSIVFSLVSKSEGVCILIRLIIMTLINLHTHAMASGQKTLAQKITTFLHPLTSSASEVECEEPGGELPSPPAPAKKTKHRDSGFSSTWLDEFPWLR